MLNIILLGLTSLSTDIASEMVYPLVPFFLTLRLGASPAVLGLIEGVAESLASVLKVVAGYLSDRLGDRKRLTIAGYAASAAGKVLLALATGWSMVLGGRVVDRLGKGIRTAPRDALVADSVRDGRHGHAFGLHRALDTSGAVIGAALAYVFLTRHAGDYTAVFLWSLVPAATGVGLLFFVREPTRASRAAVPPSLHWRALPPTLQRFLVIAFLFALGNSSNTFLLLRARTLGLTTPAVLLRYVAYNVVYALASYPAGRLSDRLGRKTVLAGGYALYGLVYAGFARLHDPGQAWALWPLFALYGLYAGATDGVERALVVDLAPASVRATGLGLHATLLGLGLLPASLVAGQLWDHVGPAAVFYLGGAFGLVAAAGLAILL